MAQAAGAGELIGLRSQPSTVCPRKLKPGQVRRVTGTGPLVGYHIACPGCRFVASYLKEEAGFEEHRDDRGPLLVAITRPPPCLRCRRRIVLGAAGLEVA